MVQTVEVVVTDDWVLLAPGQCEVQSVDDRDTYDKLFFDLVVGGSKPASDTNVFMRITLFEHANFHREAPVWLRLNKINASQSQKVIVTR